MTSRTVSPWTLEGVRGGTYRVHRGKQAVAGVGRLLQCAVGMMRQRGLERRHRRGQLTDRLRHTLQERHVGLDACRLERRDVLCELGLVADRCGQDDRRPQLQRQFRRDGQRVLLEAVTLQKPWRPATFSKKITVDVKGEILELKNSINTMVDQLNSFASEVTRVAREVGTEGKLGGQAEVKGVAGTWEDLTDNVNFMARNLTDQVRNIADVTKAVANGDLSKKITVDVRGEISELKNTVNMMVDQLSSFADEVTRVAREVGTEGKLGGQAVVKGVAGNVERSHGQREFHGP